jgi:hypothetical protein
MTTDLGVQTLMERLEKVEKQNRMFRRCGIAVLVALALITEGGAAPAQAPKPKTTATQAAKFRFSAKSVDVFWGVTPPAEWPPDTAKYYVVEGVTTNGWRFRLGCLGLPPVSAYDAVVNGPVSIDDLELSEKQYRDVEWFRQAVLEKVVWASINPRRDRMILYTVASVSGPIKTHKPLAEILVECQVENRIENAAEMLLIEVLSSQFRDWKNGTGYEVQAHTADESLTLGCTEAKGAACQSIPPSKYRATRIGSQMRLYDADLALIGAYRIVSEETLPHE